MTDGLPRWAHRWPCPARRFACLVVRALRDPPGMAACGLPGQASTSAQPRKFVATRVVQFSMSPLAQIRMSLDNRRAAGLPSRGAARALGARPPGLADFPPGRGDGLSRGRWRWAMVGAARESAGGAPSVAWLADARNEPMQPESGGFAEPSGPRGLGGLDRRHGGFSTRPRRWSGPRGRWCGVMGRRLGSAQWRGTHSHPMQRGAVVMGGEARGYPVPRAVASGSDGRCRSSCGSPQVRKSRSRRHVVCHRTRARVAPSAAPHNDNRPCRSALPPPSAVAPTSPSANRRRNRAPGRTAPTVVSGCPPGSVTSA